MNWVLSGERMGLPSAVVGLDEGLPSLPLPLSVFCDCGTPQSRAPPAPQGPAVTARSLPRLRRVRVKASRASLELMTTTQS